MSARSSDFHVIPQFFLLILACDCYTRSSMYAATLYTSSDSDSRVTLLAQNLLCFLYLLSQAGQEGSAGEGRAEGGPENGT